MAGQGIRREQHLRRQSDFQALRKSGLSRAHPLVVLRAAPNALPYVRFGFVVSKRVSKLAVVRNRIRRRMREIVRRLPLGEGWDMLIIARKDAADAAFARPTGRSGEAGKPPGDRGDNAAPQRRRRGGERTGCVGLRSE